MEIKTIEKKVLVMDEDEIDKLKKVIDYCFFNPLTNEQTNKFACYLGCKLKELK